MNKAEFHIFQGMRRDNHQIKQDSKFLWDAHNIRLTNREDNTLLSLTNEKGTSDSLVEFQGHYVGHCVLGKYLVVFTANDDTSDCTIYRVEKLEGGGYKTIILFKDTSGQPWWSDNSKGWTPEHPIEALGCYENELIQKVYWIDGINQPRVINIAKPELKLPKYIDTEDGKKQELLIDGVNLQGPNYSNDPNINEYLYYNLPKGLYQMESFDFVRTLQLQEQVDIIKNYGHGEFSSGTIQYAFSYYDKYGQESNIFYVTPLYYISPKNRGGSPEEKVSCNFGIKIWGADENFDYIRIYSIHRTSIDAVPTVKLVTDVSTYRKDPGGEISYCDTGDTGSTVDPTQLLYIGGRSIIPNSITQKNNTLFIGNYEVQSGKSVDKIKKIISGNWKLGDYKIPTNHGPVKTEGVYYSYEPSLSYANSAGFKYGEVYKFGVQVQYSTGEWSEPIFLEDNKLCTAAPWDTYPYRESRVITIMGEHIGRDLREYGVRKIRTCVVFPSPSKTRIICQGILCPTVRRANSQWDFSSSWFFRPATKFDGNNNTDVYHGAVIAFAHNTPLRTGADRGAEIQGMTASDLTNNTSSGGGNGYLVDENVVTFHSPDLEFNPSLAYLDFSNTKLRIVGMAKLGAIYGDIDIQTSTPGINSGGGSGQISPTIGYTTGRNLPVNGGLVSGLFYQDDQVKNNNGEYESGDALKYWMVYPWHRSGSLNNDENRHSGTRTAVLSKKKLSNLKFFDKNVSLGSTSIQYDISTPQLFSSNEITLVKLHPAYIGKDTTYLGNVDTMITNGKFSIYQGSSFDDALVATSGEHVITSSSEPVRIKYKSSPHLVFSLGNDKASIELLPRHISLGDAQDEIFTPPIWMQPDDPTGKDIYDGILHWYTSNVLSGKRGSINYQVAADPSLLGKYAIGRWLNHDSGASGYNLYQCRNGMRGISWGRVIIPAGGLIMKAKDTIITPSDHYLPNTTSENYRAFGSEDPRLTSIKYYKITNASEHGTNIVIEDVTDEHKGNTPTDKTSYKLKRQAFGMEDVDNLNGCPYLLIGELIREDVRNEFGEDGETGTDNMWFPASNPVPVLDTATSITVPFEYGDTWYGRYDCLKTYPFTQEDENQIVEIGSFMCETRVNIDGRYDRNRGQLSNLNMSPQNFNLMNEVYTQKDNFFNYRKLDKAYYKQHKFANQITWSKEKSIGEEVDTWTNVTLANTLDMDGEKGKVTALKTWNEYLLCFQEKALSQILFNSRIQIPTSDGVPIEIANSQKVQGSRFITNSIGCNNKWSIITTPQGIYFSDLQTNSIYLFNGQLHNISKNKGMSWWIRQNMFKQWYPVEHYQNGLRTFYDKKYEDIYFTPGITANQLDSLCYSEQLRQFTSFMSYGGTQAMFNFADGFYSLKSNNNTTYLYENNVGDYNYFYGEVKGWDFSFVSNDNPNNTKIFDTFEIKSDTYDSSNVLQNIAPITFVKASNEWQNAEDNTDKLDKTTGNLNLKNKFRIWRGLIPRPLRNSEMGLRISNPWALITLGFNPKKQKQAINKTIIHDITVKYTI